MNIYEKWLDLLEKFFGSERSDYGDCRSGNIEIFGTLSFIFIILWTIGRFIYGASVANNPDYCRMKSIGDFVIAPMYAIGCNVGKSRWDIRVN